MKALFELKFRSMTMDEYERKSLELITRYVDFIRDDTVKIHRLLSRLPPF
jgi:hypothetical protein